jgi:uncharacterized damage-inducible protein DinB/predicted RNase H-like HicB family nuclease
MTQYALYIESGPKHRKTMVHVLGLLGCIAQGATTEAAMEATPKAIRDYVRFLSLHGEIILAEDDFTLQVVQHVTEGNWLGNGDPTPGFPPDFKPLSGQDLALYARRLNWLHADLLQCIADISIDQLITEPGDGSRSIYRILEHVSDSEAVYLRYIVGKVDGLAEALKTIQPEARSLPNSLANTWQITHTRITALSASERTRLVQHGQVTWSARRGMRRMLEHAWEHLQEISSRLPASLG